VKKAIKNALFILVRHGDTLLNDQEKYRGWSDDDSASLDKKGIKQARVAGRFLYNSPVRFGYIVSSDLDRSLHTAAIIGRVLGIKDIRTDPRLRPLDVGDYTGKDKETNSIDFYLENIDEKFPNGESVAQFRARQKEASDEILEWARLHPDEKAIEIGHLSNVVYWEDIDKSLRGYLENYASDKEDLIHPGGIVAIMPDSEVIPLLGENKKADPKDKGLE